MKKLLFLFCCCVGLNFAHAQKCLNIHLGYLLSNLPASASGSQSLNKCTTNKNNQSGQTDITSFGSDLDQFDTMISKTTAEFNNTAAAAMTNHAPSYSQDDAAAAKDLAETLKSMTPEQQKEWAMQMAQARQKNPGMASQQEDASNMRLVIETQDIAGRQLKEVNDEFLAKLQALDAAADEKIKAIAKGDKSKCPSDITGLPSCSCTNDIEAKYWKQVVDIKDNYNNQKAGVLQTYLPKIKGLLTTVDNNIDKLNHGDALRTNNAKQMLFSSQSAAFANAFLISGKCATDIRKDGANSARNKLNSEKGVYDVSCSHSK